MNRLYENVNPNKLVDEFQKAGFFEIENMSFFQKKDGLEIRFIDIKEVPIYILNENGEPTEEIESLEYTKKIEHMDILANKETGLKTESIYYLDEPYTEEFELFLADIQAVIDAHDPTPYPKSKTELEILQETVDMLLIDSLMGGI